MEDTPDICQHHFRDDRKITKTLTGFTPFYLVHGVELFLPIECQILLLHIYVELLPDTSLLEKILLILEQTNGDHRATLQSPIMTPTSTQTPL